MNRPHARDPDLTLVVPTLGRAILARMLAAVQAGEVWPARIVLVDQGRRPDIAALAAQTSASGLEVLYLPSQRSGRSAGLNDGLAQVETSLVAITDDDCLVAPDWIARIGERLRRHAPALVTGRVTAGPGDTQLSVVTIEAEDIQRQPRLRFDRLSGGNMGMTLEAVRRIGPFTEVPAMRTAEDADYAYRALRAGLPIVYAPEVVVQHLAWRDSSGREDQYRSYGLSQGGLYGWHLAHGDLFMGVRALVHLARASRRWLMGTVRGDPDLAANGRAYVCGWLPGLKAGWNAFRATKR